MFEKNLISNPSLNIFRYWIDNIIQCNEDIYSKKINLLEHRLTDNKDQLIFEELIETMSPLLFDMALLYGSYNRIECVGKCLNIAFGDHHNILLECRATTFITEGTHPLLSAAKLIKFMLKLKYLYIPQPVQEKHIAMAVSCDYELKTYSWYCVETHKFNFKDCYDDLCKASTNSVIVINGIPPIGHESTPTELEWEKIASLIKERNLLVILDISFQGLYLGDFYLDGYVARLFATMKIEFILVQNFSRLFIIPNLMTFGAISFISNDRKNLLKINYSLLRYQEGTQGMTPNKTCRLFAVLNNDLKKKELWYWLKKVNLIYQNICELRILLSEKLMNSNCPEDFSYLRKNMGPKVYTNLNVFQIEYLRRRFHIYVEESGVFEITGISEKNVDYFVYAFCETYYIFSKEFSYKQFGLENTMSRFESIEMAPAVEAFALVKLFNEDSCQDKVNLTIGAYRDETGSPWVFPIVKEHFLRLATSKTYNFEYLPILGIEEFSKLSSQLLLGENNPVFKEGKVFGVQSLSGTGALTLGAQFLNKLGSSIVYISNPSWDNHKPIFTCAGFNEVRTYRYWNSKTCSIDISGFLEDLQNAPENSVIVLHACAHNPTGSDPTKEEWCKIADIMMERKLFPFLDCAYQGFASGDPDNDAWSVRMFVERGFELFVAQSYAKNFGLYNERIGNLTVVVKDPELIPRMKSLFTIIVRMTYSNPPAQGAQIVKGILGDPESKENWLASIKTMANRIRSMRKKLREELEQLETPGSWKHITEQIGMFSYTGLTPTQVEHLVKDYHIYLLHTGRISMAGVNNQNVNYIAKAIDTVVRKYPNI